MQRPSLRAVNEMLRDGGWGWSKPFDEYLRSGTRYPETLWFTALMNMPIQAWLAMRLTNWVPVIRADKETTMWPEGLEETEELSIWHSRTTLLDSRKLLKEKAWLLPEPYSMGEIPGLLTGSIASLWKTHPFVVDRSINMKDELDLVCQVLDEVVPALTTGWEEQFVGGFTLSSTNCRMWVTGLPYSPPKGNSEPEN